MSNTPEMARYREAVRYAVELRWNAPRTWGRRNLPHAGRFYAWALFTSPRRKIWTYAQATGIIGPGGVETTELAILIREDDPDVSELQPGEPFELSYTGIQGLMVAAQGRVVARRSESN